MFYSMTANISGLVRHDQMEGKEFLVVPMVMLTEGVHNGSNGPLLYPKDELAKVPSVWNYKPVVVNHPSKNGRGISACSPEVLSCRKVGVVMNTTFEDGKLKAEAWLEPDRMNAIDERIGQAIENDTMMEVSTGLYADHEKVEGEWNEEKYEAIARNFRPDHLALLPDLKGACSIEDGAGFLRLNADPEKILITNEMSHGNIRSMLHSYLMETRDDAWVEEVYSDFFVFAEGGDYFKQIYSIVDNQLEVSSTVEQVVKVTEFRSMDGAFVGNQDDNANRKADSMKKDELVQSLIDNESTHWADEDKEAMLKMNKETLEKMVPIVNEEKKEEPVENEEQKEELVENEEQQKEETVDEYIANAPKGIQGMLKHGLGAYEEEKTKLIAVITANEKNAFTEANLKQKDIEELRAIAQLAANEVNQEPSNTVQMYNFAGQAPVTENTHKEEPLLAPKIDYSK